MPNYICVMCGNQYQTTEEPPAHCLICEDERQYVNPEGQAWTTLAELQRAYHNIMRSLEPGLTETGTEPKFAIGQRALLVQGTEGNVLWDCVSLIDDATVDAIKAWMFAIGSRFAYTMLGPFFLGQILAIDKLTR